MAEISKLTKEDMRAYEQSQKVMWDNYAVLETMKKEGIEQGMEQGIEQGMEHGIEHGIESVALKMIKENIDFAFISRVIGYSIEKIEALAKRMEGNA